MKRPANMNGYYVRHLALIMLLVITGWTFAQSESINQSSKNESNIPQIMSYEGYITDNNGQPLADGQYDFTFALYTEPTGGSSVWKEVHNSVPVVNGFIQLFLGRGTPPNPLSLPFNSPYFLGIKVGNNAEMEPRLELTATGYSYRARIADEVADGSVTTEKIAPASVTDEKIKDISWNKITNIPKDLLSSSQMAERQKLSIGSNEKYPLGPGGVPANVWSLFGNSRSDSTEDMLGTTDFQALVMKTDNLERLRIRATGEIDIDSDLTVGGDLDVFGITTLHNTTESTSNNNGALVVAGGVGIARRINVGGDGLFESNLDVNGITSLNNTTESTTITNGALVVAGGVGIGKRINIGGDGLFQSNLNVDGITTLNNTTESTNSGNGALVVAGGTGIGKNLNVGSNLDVTQNGQIGGRMGIGGAAPSSVKLYVSGQGSYAGNHIALFENTGSTSPDGIAIKVSAGAPNNENNFVTFLDGNGSTRGRIEGQNATDVLTSPEYIFFTFLDAFELGLAIADVTAAASSANVCAGVGAVACPPVPSLIVGAAAKLAAQAGRVAATQAFLFDNLGVAYQSGNGDYAEYLQRMYANEEIEAGDIVGVFGGKVTKTTRGAQQIMSVSAAPIVLGNAPPKEEENGYEKVAFMGQVPVKVLGPVESGDYIIPSGREDGTGIAVSPEMMTVDEFAKVVGRAWGSSDNEFVKLVNVVIGLNSGDIVNIIKKQGRENQNLKAQLDELKTEVAHFKRIEQKVRDLEANFDRVSKTKDRAYAKK